MGLATSVSWPSLEASDTPDAAASHVAAAPLGNFGMEALCDAFEAMVAILGALGPALMIQVRNDANNLRKLRAAMAAAGPECTTVRQLLECEVAAGMHTRGPVQTSEEGDATERTGGAILSDPSAAISLLWLTRSLQFTLELANHLHTRVKNIEAEGGSGAISGLMGDEHLLVDADGEFAAELARELPQSLSADAIRHAYNMVIRPYHSWLLRKTFDMIASQVPDFQTCCNLLGAGLGEADRDEQILSDMGFFYREGQPICADITALFAELQLEDLRRV